MEIRVHLPSKPHSNQVFMSHEQESSDSESSNRAKICPHCKLGHSLFACEVFRGLTPSSRLDFVRQSRLCTNCLGTHPRSKCRSPTRCFCGGFHNTLCHLESNTKNLDEKSSSTDSQSHDKKQDKEESPSVNVVKGSDSLNLLGTILCEIKDCYGNVHQARCLLDSGSQIHAISEQFLRKLGYAYSKNTSRKSVSGVGLSTIQSQGSTEFTINSIHDSEVRYSGTALILQKIGKDIPVPELPQRLAENFQHQGYQLADPFFYKRGSIDILLGVHAYASILQPNIIINGSPSLIKSSFGYITLGQVETHLFESPSIFTIQDPTNFDLNRFWELEEVPSLPKLSIDDEYCEQHFRTTHTRDENGRYSVSIPYRLTAPQLNSNLHTARKSFFALEGRFRRDPLFAKAYRDAIKEYLELGHMKLATEDVSYVFPHHAVTKAGSSVLRIVFNASSVDINGNSLNDCLYSGPRLQKDISAIILRFLQQPVALTCDIQSMFRQILLNPDSRSAHRILWRDTPHEPLRQYEIQRVTFGVTVSPFLSNRTIRQLVVDEGHRFPNAADALTNDCFVDNVVTCTSTVQDALKLKEELSKLCTLGGFPLRKWASSHLAVLAGVPSDQLEKPFLFEDGNPAIKVLGIFWEPSSDCFRYKIVPFSGPLIKRNLLRYIASQFDPLAYVGPVITWMKCFLQHLWSAKIDWDEPIPDHLEKEWLHFTSEMLALAEIRIPRFKPTSSQDILLGFCDASSRAYGATIHSFNPSSESTRLLISKSKVAPLKTQSIPRLELCAALLLSRLVEATLRVLPNKFVAVYLYTDSTTVLKWLKKSPHTLPTFEANRVAKIQNMNVGTWAHVRSESNPADVLSRGLNPKQLINHPLWWGIPHELLPPPPETDEKLNADVYLAATQEVQPPETILHRFSSYDRMLRFIAYWRRFIHYLRRKVVLKGPLLASELKDSLLTAIRISQHADFSDDIRRVREGKDSTKQLLSLSPTIDATGCLIAGGRLENSALSPRAKHPYILSKSSHLSRLVCDYYHQLLLHAGLMTTLSMIRRKFWIISARSLLKKRIRSCHRCHRVLGKPAFSPFMANLPSCRVTPSRVFSTTIVDFAGAFSTKESNRRTRTILKSYICVFVCTCTRAISLQYVSSLSTDAFLAALTRHTCKYGIMNRLISDCGKNFVGAARNLREISEFLKGEEERLLTSMASLGIEWSFNPAYTPHFTALAESGVKSAKQLLLRTVGNTVLTIEEFSTLLHRIEASLNCRPLVPVSSSIKDGVDYLTPAHFLIGGPLFALPDVPIDPHMTPRNRWQLVQQMSQSHWRRWSADYLNTLMQRGKWTKQSSPPQVGQLVYVRQIQTSPLTWPIAVIEKLHPGPDGICRVASVRMGGKSYVRALANMVPLPTDN